MLRIAGVAFAIMGLSLAQARAAQPSVFGAYKSICQDTRADPQKAVTALGPGWSEAPAPPGPAGVQQIHRTKVVGADHWELLLIEHVFPKGDDGTPFAKRMRICMVSTSAQATGLKTAVSALMAAPPNSQPPGGVAWTYFDDATGRQYFSSGTAAETNARLAKAPLVVVMVGETPQGDVAGFTEVRALDK